MGYPAQVSGVIGAKFVCRGILGNPSKHDKCIIRLQKGHASRQGAQSKVAPDMVLIEEWHVEEVIHCANMAAGLVFMW